MKSRIKLHDFLVDFANENNLKAAYFSPPANVLMKYPCIVYSLKEDRALFADNIPYVRHLSYEIQIITSDVDSTLPYLLAEKLRYCSFDRRFVVDNLTHYVLTCYMPLDIRE